MRLYLVTFIYFSHYKIRCKTMDKCKTEEIIDFEQENMIDEPEI